MVDDEPGIRGFVGMVLEDEGFVVETAVHGRDALEKARGQRFDLAIVDLMMPVMTGWELVAIWHADPALRHIPIILMSAAYTGEAVATLGVQAFLAKPFDIDALLRTVRLLLGAPP